MEGASISGALTGALSSVQADALSAVSGAMPIAVTIGGAVLVAVVGWKMFKKLTH